MTARNLQRVLVSLSLMSHGPELVGGTGSHFPEGSGSERLLPTLGQVMVAVQWSFKMEETPVCSAAASRTELFHPVLCHWPLSFLSFKEHLLCAGAFAHVYVCAFACVWLCRCHGVHVELR